MLENEQTAAADTVDILALAAAATLSHTYRLQEEVLQRGRVSAERRSMCSAHTGREGERERASNPTRMVTL